MPLYGLLKRQHKEYDADLFAELQDLYVGGYEIQKRAKNYLPRLANEHALQHEDRCRSAAYLPYLGQIVDQLNAWLFGDGLTVLPAADAEDPETPGEMPDQAFYGELAKDANLAGRGFVDMMRATVPEALIKRRAIVGVDLPKANPDDQIVSEADEKELGLDRAYLVDIPIESLINWDRNADGSFKWAVLNRVSQPQLGPLEPSDLIVEEFKIWRTDTDGVVVWEVYRIAYQPKRPPNPLKTDVPLVESGSTSFAEIPIAELCLPEGLWVGNKIGPVVKEHWQRRSHLNASENKSLYEVPVVNLGSEIGAPHEAMPSAAQQNPNRGNDPIGRFSANGALVLGENDKFGFFGPSGVAFKIVDEQLASLKDEIFRVVHLMAASVSNNKAAALGRSGLAKHEDKNDTAIVLGAIGDEVRHFATRIYTIISDARGEDVVWHAKGLEDYESDDRAQVLAEALQVDAIGIPSPTFKAGYKTRLAFKLEPGLPPDTQATIRGEIHDGVQHEGEMHDLMQEAAKATAAAQRDGAGDVPPPGGSQQRPPPTPGRPSGGPPGKQRKRPHADARR